MAQSRARRGVDFESLLDDADDGEGWYGHAWPEASAYGQAVGDQNRDDSSRDDLLRAEVHDDGCGEPLATRWDPRSAPRTISDGKAGIGEWTFTVSGVEPWYRSKAAKRGIIAAATLAIAVPLTLLVVRNPGNGTEESTTVPSQAPTSSQPGATSPAPPLSPATPSPPAPPPPEPTATPAMPPPPAEAGPQPVIARQYPQQRQSPPRQQNKPEIGVTRTPGTRTPISATPPPPPPPQRNSSTPGDAPGRGGGWGWGW